MNENGTCGFNINWKKCSYILLLVQAYQALHFPFNVKRQARGWQLTLLKSKIWPDPGLVLKLPFPNSTLYHATVLPGPVPPFRWRVRAAGRHFLRPTLWQNHQELDELTANYLAIQIHTRHNWSPDPVLTNNWQPDSMVNMDGEMKGLAHK